MSNALLLIKAIEAWYVWTLALEMNLNAARWANIVDEFIGRVTFMRIKWTLMRCFISPRILFSRNFGSSWRCNIDWPINIANITLSEVNITDLHMRQFGGIAGTKGITLKTFRLNPGASPLIEFRNGSAPNTLLPCVSQTRSMWWRPSISKVHNVINFVVCGTYYSLNSNRHLMKRANLIQKSISQIEIRHWNRKKAIEISYIHTLASDNALMFGWFRKWVKKTESEATKTNFGVRRRHTQSAAMRIHANTRVAIKSKLNAPF